MRQLREEMSYKEQQVDGRMQIYANEIESLREEMNQTMDKYVGPYGRFKRRNGNVIYLYFSCYTNNRFENKFSHLGHKNSSMSLDSATVLPLLRV
jgi:hypothetical protein